MKKKEIKVKKLNKRAKMPTQGSEFSAGWDLYAAIEEPVTIQPGETKKIGTGLSFELPIHMFGAIYARSGLATKYGIAPANKVGVCDCDYRGEYIVALHNHSNESYTIQPEDRIAQVIFSPYIPAELIEVKELTETARGDGGFSSTGR